VTEPPAGRPSTTNARRFGPTHRSVWDRIDNPLVRVELRDQAGWWICRYPTSQDLIKNAPDEVVGPYATQAQAVRILNSVPSPPGPGVRVDLASPPGAVIPPIDAT
jgi:hypothetical protein